MLEEKISSMLEHLSQTGYRRTSETHPMHYAADSVLEDEIRFRHDVYPSGGQSG